jgi:hypothetical protein
VDYLAGQEYCQHPDFAIPTVYLGKGLSGTSTTFEINNHFDRIGTLCDLPESTIGLIKVQRAVTFYRVNLDEPASNKRA